MNIQAPRGILVLLVLCLLQVANGNVERLGAKNPLQQRGDDDGGGDILGSVGRLLGGNGSLLGDLLGGSGTVGGLLAGILPTTPSPILPDVEESCRKVEQRAVSLTQTALALSLAPFFVGVGFPSFARVGETFPVTIAALSILGSPIPIRVSLGESPAYEIVGQNARSVCLRPNVQVDTTISVRPIQAGPATITTFTAVDTSPGCGPSVSTPSSEIRSPTKFEHPGIPKRITFSKFMCSGEDLEEEDFLAEWDLEVPDASVIPGSIKAWVTVTGDLLGPTLDNLGDLIKMPYGCGEQNMITMSPNIYVLQYLKETQQLTSDVEARLLTNIKEGYKRELTYKLDDESYSAFGPRDGNGSTWLTAFVVKSFAQVNKYAPGIVDPNEIAASSKWLKDRRDLSTGCFNNVGRVIHKEMQGGIGGSAASGALTAFVMVALLEAGEPPSSSVITEGKACIEAATAFGSLGASNNYLLTMKAYVYGLAGFPEASAAVGISFTGMTRTIPGSYWPMYSSGTTTINGALSVETTSYGLLAVLTVYDLQNHILEPISELIVKWLSSKMNSHGGFVSTQDTVLALQALAFFAKRHPPPAVGVTVSVKGNGLDEVFEINKINNLVTQKADVDVIPNFIEVRVDGNGCALVQAVVSYSVENPQKFNGLTVNIKPQQKRAQDCRSTTFDACVTYNLRDKESNMAIIEITLVTGYTPEQSDLESLVCGGRGNIKMYEVNGSKLIFYVERLTASETCVKFRVNRETAVQNAKNGTIKIYDYYEPEIFVSQTFALSQSSCYA